MNKLSLDKSMNIEVRARLIARGTDQPLTGAAYKVRFFEREVFEDDYLGESVLDAMGYASIIFPASKLRHRFEDAYPDLFFVVYKNNELLFQSPPMENVDTLGAGHLKMGEGEVIELGSFLINA